MSLSDFPSHFRAQFPEVASVPVLAALSGGADSVALLHLLATSDLDLDLHAAYVDHQTRPDEAVKEIAFCRGLCASLDVQFHCVGLSPNTGASRGQEADWRKRRYNSLRSLARSLGAAAIATAHHRDDVAEGVLVQMLRGASVRAMAGIEEFGANGIIRPLLPFSRQQIIAYLEERGIHWCEDSSNRNVHHLRNRIRHHILPELEASFPSLRGHLVHLARALAQDEDFAQHELRSRARWIDPFSPDGGIPVASVADLHPALRSRWLHAQAARIGLSHVSRSQLSAFESLLDEKRPTTVNLDQRWRLRRVAQSLWLEPPHAFPPIPLQELPGETLDLPIPGWTVATVPGESFPAHEGFSWRPPDHGRVELRSRQPGDRLQDDEGLVKLSTVMAQKLPRHLRNAWPVFTVDGTICWIPGVWRGPPSAVPRTERVEVFRR